MYHSGLGCSVFSVLFPSIFCFPYLQSIEALCHLRQHLKCFPMPTSCIDMKEIVGEYQFGFRQDRNQTAESCSLYQSIRQLVVTYAAETLSITKRDEDILFVFGHRILRQILGLLHEPNSWRRRMKNLIIYFVNEFVLRKINIFYV